MPATPRSVVTTTTEPTTRYVNHTPNPCDTEAVLVRVPAEARPGDQLRVALPSGASTLVTVPAGGGAPLGCTVGCTLHIVTEAIPSQNQKAAVSVTVV